MKINMEKLSVLALSSMLVSAFSISPILPFMLADFNSYSSEQVELLISVPSFLVLVVLIANRPLNRWLNEGQMVTIGLLLMTFGGLVPLWIQEYWYILISRMFLGLGIGMLNAKAISMISERYQGLERIQMLGFRGSAEVVGSAVLTLAVGQLMKLDWTYAFSIYGFGFVILFLYLRFVPQLTSESSQTRTTATLSSSQMIQVVELAFFAGWNVCISSSINLRIPLMVTETGMGTASSASLVLSLYQLIGIGSGLMFAVLLKRFSVRLLVVSYLAMGLATLGIAFSTSLLTLSIAALGAGFVNSVLLTSIFHRLAEEISSNLLNTATAIVLVGCNLGGALSPYVLKAMGLIGESYQMIFGLFSITCLLCALLAWGNIYRRKLHASG